MFTTTETDTSHSVISLPGTNPHCQPVGACLAVSQNVTMCIRGCFPWKAIHLRIHLKFLLPCTGASSVFWDPTASTALHLADIQENYAGILKNLGILKPKECRSADTVPVSKTSSSRVVQDTLSCTSDIAWFIFSIKTG